MPPPAAVIDADDKLEGGDANMITPLERDADAESPPAVKVGDDVAAAAFIKILSRFRGEMVLLAVLLAATFISVLLSVVGSD